MADQRDKRLVELWEKRVRWYSENLKKDYGHLAVINMEAKQTELRECLFEFKSLFGIEE